MLRSFELRETNNGFILKISKIEPSAHLSQLSGSYSQEEYCFTSKGDLLRFLDKTLKSETDT